MTPPHRHVRRNTSPCFFSRLIGVLCGLLLLFGRGQPAGATQPFEPSRVPISVEQEHQIVDVINALRPTHLQRTQAMDSDEFRLEDGRIILPAYLGPFEPGKFFPSEAQLAEVPPQFDGTSIRFDPADWMHVVDAQHQRSMARRNSIFLSSLYAAASGGDVAWASLPIVASLLKGDFARPTKALSRQTALMIRAIRQMVGAKIFSQHIAQDLERLLALQWGTRGVSWSPFDLMKPYKMKWARVYGSPDDPDAEPDSFRGFGTEVFWVPKQPRYDSSVIPAKDDVPTAVIPFHEEGIGLGIHVLPGHVRYQTTLKQLQLSPISSRYYMQSIVDEYITEVKPGAEKTGITWYHHTVDDPLNPTGHFNSTHYWEMNDHRRDPPSRPRRHRGRDGGGGGLGGGRLIQPAGASF